MDTVEEAVVQAERARQLRMAALANFMDDNVEFSDDEEKAEFYDGLENLAAIYTGLGRVEAYRQIINYAGVTPKTAEVARHLALQEMDLLEKKGVKFINQDEKEQPDE